MVSPTKKKRCLGKGMDGGAGDGGWSTLSYDADVLHIHQVCAHWRASTAPLAAARPWIVAGHETSRIVSAIGEDYSFWLPHGGGQRIIPCFGDAPPAGLPYCCGTPRGWLALADAPRSPTRLVLWEPSPGRRSRCPRCPARGSPRRSSSPATPSPPRPRRGGWRSPASPSASRASGRRSSSGAPATPPGRRSASRRWTGSTARRSTAASSTSPSGTGTSTRTTSATTPARHGHRRASAPPSSTSTPTARASCPGKAAACAPRTWSPPPTASTCCSPCSTGNATAGVYRWSPRCSGWSGRRRRRTSSSRR
ncbi:Os05g0150100 [Oryza sativa Japonica Group]|uniref:Os05g0150100 protein n=1 Tax=Oryza sativa subsp. japonica TaxID=39947 RepID=A0A0N7KK58_ORYSJ|nr:Os05g0150100 [Oryza sativa Japonica Group]